MNYSLYTKCGIYLLGKTMFFGFLGHHDHHLPIESLTRLFEDSVRRGFRSPGGQSLQSGDSSNQSKHKVVMIVQQAPPSNDSSQDSTSMETLPSRQPDAATGQSSQIPMVVLMTPSSGEVSRVPSPHSHSCHLCSKAFASKELLEAHLNIHPTYCPHKCDRCSEVFTNFRLLELHMRFHHKCECPFRCSLCSLSFPTKRALNMHLTKHGHGDTKVQCKTCFKWFNSCRAMLEHRSRHFAK
ncbi:uncharacterized protein LOC119164720 isoform X1 [Rhipicephalus microplus]|uniref:uncharacterized protein LOC119164720 isoform X1 n=1 Tax=Rhipicephalus microplus TaxID=6941 RepID=UPI002376B05F